MLLKHFVTLYICAACVYSLSNKLFTIVNLNANNNSDSCGLDEDGHHDDRPSTLPSLQVTYKTIRHATEAEFDPWVLFQKIILKSIYGPKVDEYGATTSTEEVKRDQVTPTDNLAHYPMGNAMRAELFQNKSTVHLPAEELLHKGHCHLKVTQDLMQTALNAFGIILYGNVKDIMRLPGEYVLRSARTIAMMKIAQEKLFAMWYVVKGSRPAETITYETLALYRPLFKYLSGKEMANLNLSDERILNYIGTHADLDRHQVGVVASRYVRLNPQWQSPKYLNLMNNLLCGVPMAYMRRLPENTYLQLTNRIFYHIHACDPLQRRFYLAMMTRTQALGKSYSWSARDVARLGLLLTEVEGSELSSVIPEAMSGITAQVMLEMPTETIKHITETQLRYLKQKPLNILAKKIQFIDDQDQLFINNSIKHHLESTYCITCLFYFALLVFCYI